MAGRASGPQKPMPLILKRSLLEQVGEEDREEPAHPGLPGKRPLKRTNGGKYYNDLQLDGCSVWNVHNIVFGSSVHCLLPAFNAA